MKIKNTIELRQMLLETIQDVKDGKTDFRQAKAIADISSKILQSVKIDLEVLKYNANSAHVDKAGEKVLQLVNQ